jgi:hypothetical protein
MKKIGKYIKQLLCRHDFIWDDRYDVMRPGPSHFVCTKCARKSYG